MSTRADLVVAALREYVASYAFDESDTVGFFDQFTPADSIEAMEGIERDRVFCPQVLEGPMLIPSGSRCRESMRIALAVRYFMGLESMLRGLRDVSRLRRWLHGFPQFESMAGADVVIRIGKVMHDYSTLTKTDLVVLDVAVEYHVET